MLQIGSLRLETLTCTIETCTWNAIISLANVRIILTRLVQKATNASFLRPRFFKKELISFGSSIRLGLNETGSLLLYGIGLRLFSEKPLKSPLHL